MPTPLLRPAQADDIPAIVGLWEEMVRLHADRDERFRCATDAPATYAAHLTRQLAVPETRLTVMDVDRRPQAYCFHAVSEAPPVFLHRRHGIIHDVAVTAAWRRRGLGSQLVRDAIQWLTAQGAVYVDVRIAMHNPEAAAFWRQHGFDGYVAVHRRSTP